MEVLRVLKKHGCDLNSLTQEDKSTALHLAADNGNLEAVRWLISNGVNIHAENKNLKSAQELAKTAGDKATYEYLLRKGKEVRNICK